MTTGMILAERQDYSRARLEELGEAIASFDELQGVENLSIYATGSYGRLEASAASDIDLFFIHAVDDPEATVSRIRKTVVDADLIRLLRYMDFPPFSGDGEYLEIHNLARIKETLGSREDDYRNFFTARLLLLLESRSVFGDGAYDDVLGQITRVYFDDFHDHDAEFRPLFLVNDILRFWKTLCLNYEHRRDRQKGDLARNKNHLMNVKLKFSRMLTCYSMVASLAAEPIGVSPDRVLDLARLTPMDRLRDVARRVGAVHTLQRLLDEYEWFLVETARPKAEALTWIANGEVRDEAFSRARSFGAAMYEIVAAACGESEQMRYLVI